MQSAVTPQAKSYTPGTRPVELILGPRPNRCQCSFAWCAEHGEYLKFVSTACLVHFGIKTLKAA